jgi:hypothetical protein
LRGAGLTLHGHLPGKPGLTVGLPFRFPLRESPQFFSARASWSSPVLNASLEHSAHQGQSRP